MNKMPTKVQIEMDVFFSSFLWGPNQRLCQLGPSPAGRQSLPVVIVNVYPHNCSATCLMTVEMEDQMNRTARLVCALNCMQYQISQINLSQNKQCYQIKGIRGGLHGNMLYVWNCYNKII